VTIVVELEEYLVIANAVPSWFTETGIWSSWVGYIGILVPPETTTNMLEEPLPLTTADFLPH
jgi:hypothetical protein